MAIDALANLPTEAEPTPGQVDGSTAAVDVTPANTDDLDIDDLALLEAEAEVERESAEEAPADESLTADPAPADAATGDQPAAADPAPAADAPASAPVTVPIERLNQALEAKRQAEAQGIYYQGVAAAALEGQRSASGAPVADPATSQPEPTPDEQIQALQAQRADLARKYDAAEISSMAELNEQQTAIDNEIRRIDRAQTAAAATAAAPQTGAGQTALADQVMLDQQEQKILAGAPYLNLMSEEQVDQLMRMAADEAALMGKPIERGTLGTYRLRAAVAHKSNQLGPRLFPNFQVPQRQQPKPTPNPAANPINELPAIAAARQQKHLQAANLPPDPNNLGSAARGGEGLSDAKVLAMSDVDLESMTDAQLDSLA